MQAVAQVLRPVFQYLWSNMQKSHSRLYFQNNEYGKGRVFLPIPSAKCGSTRDAIELACGICKQISFFNIYQRFYAA